MVTPTAGAVVLVPFPFSDLSQAKLRPAVVLAGVGRGDWILCQITSNPYGDARAILLTDVSFAVGHCVSRVMPALGSCSLLTTLLWSRTSAHCK